MIYLRFIARFKKNWYLILGYLFLMMIGLEIIARLFIANAWVLKTTSDFSSLKWQLKWESDHSNPQPTQFQIDVFDPVLGWSQKKGLKNAEFMAKTVNFSAAGTRGTTEYTQKKPADKFRILIVGDSFTFGDQVSDSETYAAYLENILPNTEVLNFGVHGYGLDQMLLMLQRQAPIYQPDLVIFGYIYDDLHRTILSFREYQKPRFKIKSGQLVAPLLISEPAVLIEKAKKRSGILTALELIYDRIKFHTYPGDEIRISSQLIMQAAINLAAENKFQLVFLFLPTGDEMLDQNHKITYPEKLATDLCSSSSAKFFSARKYFNQATLTGINFNTKVHYQPYVHEIIAKGLAKDLRIFLEASQATQAAVSEVGPTGSNL